MCKPNTVKHSQCLSFLVSSLWYSDLSSFPVPLSFYLCDSFTSRSTNPHLRERRRRRQKKKAMSGEGKSAATQCDKCVVGMPVEQPAHPTNQHTATWIANDARPASFQSNHLNAAVSRSVSDMVKHNKSESDNPYLQMVPGWSESIEAYFAFEVLLWLMVRLKNDVDALLVVAASANKMCTTLNRCGKKFDDAKQKVEELAGNFWHHREFLLRFFLAKHVRIIR